MKFSERTERYIDVITKQMESIGVLEEADKENLELLKTQYELYVRALEELETNGLTCVDKNGKSSTNPAFSVQRSAIQNITALLRELSISARQRRFLTKDAIVNSEDPMDEFLNRMNERED